MDPVLQSAHARRDARLAGVPPGSTERYHVIAGVRNSTRQPRVTVQMVKRATCDIARLEASDLEGPYRYGPVVQARQVAMYLTRELTERSFPAIGDAFGWRDHTTVMHACREIPKRAADSQRLADFIKAVRERAIALSDQADAPPL